ncbi:MAG: phenylalanine--tRNA ligase subunit beta [Planctomycetales bacterium]|nr:phenylalanine--tRNA ligase subunit beta [Planctomycetales bacterium]
MLVCWDWLKEYVNVTVSVEELAHRFAMSGLNHESTAEVGSDTIVDLEVTSNRSDCLGHIGIAREAAVLLKQSLSIPSATPPEVAQAASQYIQISNQYLAACPYYTARIIRGIKVGASPAWLARRLTSVGINSVNNVVDITNYVMLECGQPLHAFDLSRLRDEKIVVRPARADEKFLAIDHKTYQLDEEMVVIADGQGPVALGGVMGGAESEVSDATVDLLIEAASFSPQSIRRTARKLKLHSPSSFRFERRPDPQGLDWASRRCCELILEIAGGELLAGTVTAGSVAQPPQVIELRRTRIPKVLGIEISPQESDQILVALGCQIIASDSERVTVLPPSWRGDLTREIDLIEEVARIHGYDKIPENVSVPMRVAPVRPKDIALERVRHVLSARGIDEAMTPSVVNDNLESFGSLWTKQSPLATDTPLLVGARTLRRSLIPSLLSARYNNQTQAIRNAQLYEVANVYLPGSSAQELPRENCMLAIVGAGDLRQLRGVVEEIVSQLVSVSTVVDWTAEKQDLFENGSLQRLSISGQTIGYVGLISPKAQTAYSLEQATAAAELNLDTLTSHLQEVRQADPVSVFPAVARDLNFVVDEGLKWSALASLCRQHGGDCLQSVDYQETYRDAKRDGPGKKRLLLSLRFVSLHRTLTGKEVDQAVQQVVSACDREFAAKLLG